MLNRKKQYPQLPNSFFDETNWFRAEILFPPPLVLTKTTGALVDAHPETHADEATSALVEIASTRILTHVTEDNGHPVTWTNRGPISRQLADKIGCDARKMVSWYYPVRNPPVRG